jgi:hypothetical protein
LPPRLGEHTQPVDRDLHLRLTDVGLGEQHLPVEV